jgi:hypothetical protein
MQPVEDISLRNKRHAWIGHRLRAPPVRAGITAQSIRREEEQGGAGTYRLKFVEIDHAIPVVVQNAHQVRKVLQPNAKQCSVHELSARPRGANGGPMGYPFAQPDAKRFQSLQNVSDVVFEWSAESAPAKGTF